MKEKKIVLNLGFKTKLVRFIRLSFLFCKSFAIEIDFGWPNFQCLQLQLGWTISRQKLLICNDFVIGMYASCRLKFSMLVNFHRDRFRSNLALKDDRAN